MPFPNRETFFFFQSHTEQLPQYALYIYRLLHTVVAIPFEVALSGIWVDERKSCNLSEQGWDMVKQKGTMGTRPDQVFKRSFLSLLKSVHSQLPPSQKKTVTLSSFIWNNMNSFTFNSYRANDRLYLIFYVSLFTQTLAISLLAV